MISEIVNGILGIPTASAYTWAAADVTAIHTELTAMLAAYFLPILGIFALLFGLSLFRRLVRQWVGR